MPPDAHDEQAIRELSYNDAVRMRPAMYVGSTALFGLINYLVCPIALLLGHGARRISVTVDDAITVASDACISISEQNARIIPFEAILSLGPGHSFEGTVLNALSRELAVRVTTAESTTCLNYEQGKRIRQATVPTEGETGSSLRFIPDSDIFTITSVSSFAFESYFRRLSYLHPGVAFRFTTSAGTKEFSTINGTSDLFTAVSSPYQIMHSPIHIRGVEGQLQLELVMAYHSWSDDHLWCFINNGRAVEGGTHEKGLRHALKQLPKRLSMPKGFHNGVVAVMSLRYPDVVWEGCIKAKIGNPELTEMVSKLVVNETVQWLAAHPNSADEISKLQVFQFPEAWYS